MSEHGLNFYLPVDEAIAGSRDGHVDGDTLLRSLALHASWLVPGRQTAEGMALGVIEKPGGGRILEVYSNREHLLQLEKQQGAELTSSIVELNGFEWMRQLEALEVERVNINQGSPETIHYKSHQIPLLIAWGALGRVEAALYFPDRVQDHMDALTSYVDYAVVVMDDEEGGALMLAPDPQGRRLGAIFTTFAAANDFANTMATETDVELSPVVMEPAKWVPMFQRLELDGIVFNAWSSLPTVAVNSGILGPLAERLDATIPNRPTNTSQ